jgi:23S rRNA-/tRNA-specific pseudouridylate synthase
VLHRARAAAAKERKQQGVDRQLKKRAKSLEFPARTPKKEPGKKKEQQHALERLLGGGEVLHENSEVLVLSKPPGVLVHPVLGTPNKGPGSVTVTLFSLYILAL